MIIATVVAPPLAFIFQWGISRLSKKPSIFVSCSNLTEINRQFETLPDEFSLVFRGDSITETVVIVTISIENNGSADIIKDDIISDFKIELPKHFQALSISIGDNDVLNPTSRIEHEDGIYVSWELLKVGQKIPVTVIGTYTEKVEISNFHKDVSFKSFLRDINISSRRKPLWSTILKFFAAQTVAFSIIFSMFFFIDSPENFLRGQTSDEEVALKISSFSDSGIVSACHIGDSIRLTSSCVDMLNSEVKIVEPFELLSIKYIGINFYFLILMYVLVFIYMLGLFFLFRKTMRSSTIRTLRRKIKE